MADPERDTRLMELFLRAVELEAAERAAFVLDECGDDDELRRELEEMLEVESAGLGAFLEKPPTLAADRLTTALGRIGEEPSGPRPPEIDGYEDLVLVGEGGMGAVYRAQQTRPIRRTVAIKVIRAGMDSSTVLGRFEVERQALARMSHSYVAAVHDAGADGEGRPYLVMEFVDGLPLIEFCRRERLDLVERVELCAKVTEAVEHAHRRGVLHRDLKPSNVLVTRQDGVAVPKIIDFGIAKSILGDLAENTFVTEQGAFLGTPGYMSPEQFDLDPSKVDTRTDVYALGVLVYEALTGELPLDADRLRTSGLGKMVHALQTEVPPKPSTRLRGVTIGDGTSPRHERSWAQRLRGDLDWVAMKALSKDPERRYATPGAMADDLRRFLRHEPTAAGPPSGAFRARRFVRRYRIQVAAAALLFLSLSAGLTGTLWFLFQSQSNEAEAKRRADDAIAAQAEQFGSALAARAALATEDDPNLAMLLALEADRYAGAYAAASPIYRALPGHDLEGSQNLRDRPTRELLFLDDGSLLAQTMDSVFWRLDPDTSTVLQRYDGHRDRITGIDFATDVDRAVTCSRDGTARVWAIDGGDCLAVVEHGERVASVQFSPDRLWFTTQTDSGVIRVCRRSNGQVRWTYGSSEAPFADSAFHPSEPTLLLHRLDGSGAFIDLDDGSVAAQMPSPTPEPRTDDPRLGISRVRFSPSGERLIRTFGPVRVDNNLQVMTRTGEVLRHIPGCLLKRGALEEPHMALVDGAIEFVSLETGETVRTLPSEPLRSLLGISRNGRRFIAVDAQLQVCVFDMDTGEKIRRVAGSSDKLWFELRAAFHPDGKRFTVSGPRARFWALEPEYEPLQVFDGPSRFRWNMRVTLAEGPEGALALAHFVDDGGRSSWSLWNIDERRRLRTLSPEGCRVLSLSHDGRRLIGRFDLPPREGEGVHHRFEIFDLEGRRIAACESPQGGTRHWIGPHAETMASTFDAGDGRMLVRTADVETGEILVEEEHPKTFFHFLRRPALGTAVTHVLGKRSELFDFRTGETLATFPSFDGAINLYAAL
ncbi:MAG: serine/threonine-protein kinase, partial [Planctomycetota bacterium]